MQWSSLKASESPLYANEDRISLSLEGALSSQMKILISYDASECADAALEDLVNAGLPSECFALVVSVAEVWLPPPPPSAYEFTGMAEVADKPAALEVSYEKQLRKVAEAKAHAEQGSNRLKAIFPKWNVSPEASTGSPAWELLFRADKWKPDLIVVGSHGRSALGRFVLGSVSQRVLTEASCSVRIARGRVEEPSPLRIIVGVDGSAGAEAAVRAVASRQWAAGSEARVVVVDDPFEPTLVGNLIPGVAESVADINREFREKLKTLVDGMANRLTSENLATTGIVAEGDPKRVIVNMAEEWGANCIFVGSTGFSSRLERVLLGSVSAAIAARAHCTVEVVREPKE